MAEVSSTLFSEWLPSIHNQNHPTVWMELQLSLLFHLLLVLFFCTKEVFDTTDALIDGFWVDLFLRRFGFVYQLG